MTGTERCEEKATRDESSFFSQSSEDGSGVTSGIRSGAECRQTIVENKGTRSTQDPGRARTREGFRIRKKPRSCNLQHSRAHNAHTQHKERPWTGTGTFQQRVEVMNLNRSTITTAVHLSIEHRSRSSFQTAHSIRWIILN